MFLILKAFTLEFLSICLKVLSSLQKNQLISLITILSLINQAWKTLLFHENTPWVKKEGNEDYDVPMGCFDGADVSKLVGTYILSQLKGTFQHHSVWLYRDDGFPVVKGLSRPEINIMKKRVIKIFKDCGLKITIKGNLKIANFLD